MSDKKPPSTPSKRPHPPSSSPEGENTTAQNPDLLASPTYSPIRGPVKSRPRIRSPVLTPKPSPEGPRRSRGLFSRADALRAGGRGRGMGIWREEDDDNEARVSGRSEVGNNPSVLQFPRKLARVPGRREEEEDIFEIGIPVGPRGGMQRARVADGSEGEEDVNDMVGERSIMRRNDVKDIGSTAGSGPRSSRTRDSTGQRSHTSEVESFRAATAATRDDSFQRTSRSARGRGANTERERIARRDGIGGTTSSSARRGSTNLRGIGREVTLPFHGSRPARGSGRGSGVGETGQVERRSGEGSRSQNDGARRNADGSARGERR